MSLWNASHFTCSSIPIPICNFHTTDDHHTMHQQSISIPVSWSSCSPNANAGMTDAKKMYSAGANILHPPKSTAFNPTNHTTPVYFYVFGNNQATNQYLVLNFVTLFMHTLSPLYWDNKSFPHLDKHCSVLNSNFPYFHHVEPSNSPENLSDPTPNQVSSPHTVPPPHPKVQWPLARIPWTPMITSSTSQDHKPESRVEALSPVISIPGHSALNVATHSGAEAHWCEALVHSRSTVQALNGFGITKVSSNLIRSPSRVLRLLARGGCGQ